MSGTQNEAVVYPDFHVEIVTKPIPKPNSDQVLIKVEVSGTNPKDWKLPMFTKRAHNSGDDIAGTVAAVGENVTEFKVGDRVAAFHEMGTPDGSFAEYAIAWAYTTFHLPKITSFEEAATIPLAAMTAAVGLYLEMKLPPPWNPTLEPTPLLVYGGSGSVGAFAIKLARASNIHPIIAVAGGGASFVETLIDRSKGDTIVDYRKGDESLISQIKEALKKSGHEEIKYAYDGVSEKGSYDNISQILAKDAGSQFVVVLPPKADNKIDKSIKWGFSNVGRVHKGVDPESPEGKAGIKLGGRDFGYVYYRVFARALADGWLTAHPYEVIPGGLNGVETGIRNLAGFKNSAKKYVYRIAETSASSSL